MASLAALWAPTLPPQTGLLPLQPQLAMAPRPIAVPAPLPLLNHMPHTAAGYLTGPYCAHHPAHRLNVSVMAFTNGAHCWQGPPWRPWAPADVPCGNHHLVTTEGVHGTEAQAGLGSPSRRARHRLKLQVTRGGWHGPAWQHQAAITLGWRQAVCLSPLPAGMARNC